MAAFVKIQAFVEHLAEGVHNLQTGALTVALSVNATPPTATMAQLTDLTQIAYTNLSSRVIGAPTSSLQTGGIYKLILPDLVITCSTAPANTFRWVTIYNDTATAPADALICYFDYGADVTLGVGETFTLDFDGANGLLQIQ